MRRSNLLGRFMKSISLSGILLFLVAAHPLQAAISVGTGLPGGALISNPTGTSGSSVIGNGTTPVKGNSFVLATDTSITSVTFMIDAVNDVSGTLQLDFFNLSGTPDNTAENGQTPAGAAIYTQSNSMPRVIAGDYVTIALDTPLDLPPGHYAFILRTSDLNFKIRLNKDNAYTQGELIRQTASTGVYTDRNYDMVFAIEGSVVRPPASDGPNIVFVLVDDWGWTDHSFTNAAQGHQSLYFQTPNFERLCEAGVSLTSAYAQPNCAPTRAALLTGQYSCRTGNGVYNVTSLNRGGSGRTTYTTPANQGDEHINGNEHTITIGEAFINSGYVTAHFGKYHAGSSTLSDPTYVLNQGFDFNYGGKNDGAPGAYHAENTTPRTFHSRVGPELDPFAADYDLPYISNNLVPYANSNDPTTLVGTKKHLTDAMADAFISFMDNHASGSMSNYPVYAQVHFYAVHSPVEPRSDLKAKYDGITPPPESTHNNASYAALIEGMDHSLGRIIDYLNDPNGDGNPVDSIATNTLLVFCSDNGGTHVSNAPLRNKKGTHFQGGIRVPSVASMPGTIPTNEVSDTLIHVVDFYPTMLDFAGGVYPDSTTHPLDGVSLHNHLLDPDNNARNREPVFYHFPGYMDTRAYACSMVIKEVNGKRFKYIYSYDPYYAPSSGYDQHQLYNLTDDISETVNLLDYIDEENTGDSSDPSTTEEYWNYILYKDIGSQLTADLNTWLVGDPSDTTWSPIHVTYKDNYPGLDPALVGEEAALPPTSIPDLEIPEGQVLASENLTANEVTITFRSEAGFLYNIQASGNLMDWIDVATDIVGLAGSTTQVVTDSARATDDSRFYRAILRAE
jgi:arylsulfatase A-like enzyme